MFSLNLPAFEAKIITRDGKRSIFDVIRRRYVALTPEEWVRQHFVHFLMTHKGYPQALMANEVQVRERFTATGMPSDEFVHGILDIPLQLQVLSVMRSAIRGWNANLSMKDISNGRKSISISSEENNNGSCQSK